MNRRSRTWMALGMLATLSLTGCQTWIGGMTLPSPHYLNHPPQYFPPDPDFPLTNELATQERYAGLIRPDEGKAEQLPAPAPVVPPALPR
jgi:hypothetical protein